MGISNLDLSFLNNIQVDIKPKSIRIANDEAYMLKFAEFKNLSFSTYVKQLIIADIEKYCNKKDALGASISKADLKELIKEVLKETSYEKEEHNKVKNNDESIAALLELGIKKR